MVSDDFLYKKLDKQMPERFSQQKIWKRRFVITHHLGRIGGVRVKILRISYSDPGNHRELTGQGVSSYIYFYYLSAVGK